MAWRIILDVDIIETMKFDISNLLANPYIMSPLTLFLISYAGMARPTVPVFIANLFKSTIYRLFILTIVAWTATKNIGVSLIAAISFVFTIHLINQREIEEGFSDTVGLSKTVYNDYNRFSYKIDTKFAEMFKKLITDDMKTNMIPFIDSVAKTGSIPDSLWATLDKKQYPTRKLTAFINKVSILTKYPRKALKALGNTGSIGLDNALRRLINSGHAPIVHKPQEMTWHHPALIKPHVTLPKIFDQYMVTLNSGNPKDLSHIVSAPNQDIFPLPKRLSDGLDNMCEGSDEINHHILGEIEDHVHNSKASDELKHIAIEFIGTLLANCSKTHRKHEEYQREIDSLGHHNHEPHLNMHSRKFHEVKYGHEVRLGKNGQVEHMRIPHFKREITRHASINVRNSKQTELDEMKSKQLEEERIAAEKHVAVKTKAITNLMAKRVHISLHEIDTVNAEAKHAVKLAEIAKDAELYHAKRVKEEATERAAKAKVGEEKAKREEGHAIEEHRREEEVRREKIESHIREEREERVEAEQRKEAIHLAKGATHGARKVSRHAEKAARRATEKVAHLMRHFF